MSRILIVFIVALMLAACAGREQAGERPGEIYLRHTGTATDQVRYGSIRGWQAVGDEAVLIDFGARGHYLFELSPNCHFEIRSAPTLRLDTRMRGVVNRFDHVMVGSERCNITRILPVDMDAARAELSERQGSG